MKRPLAFVAMLALLAPTFAAAQGYEHHPPGKGPPPHGPPPHGAFHPGPPGPPHGAFHPGPVGPHAAFVFHGHPYAWHPAHFPHPWIYPPGFGYRLWAVGAILPPLFWSTPTYYYADWATMGLPPPDPGYQYVEYGPDLLLVNVATGQVVQVFPGAFN
jgi:hypothetical protein